MKVIKTILSEEFRTARILHKCSHCDQNIEPGTQYFRIASTAENTIFVDKCHIKCHDEIVHKLIEPS